jgi:hypothetical protein
MATYVNDLRLKEIATGDEAGTWGTSTNTNLELIGEALGYGTQDCFASDADATTTVADGASDPARAMYFKVTSSATLTATRTLTIAPNTISRVMLIENATTGSQSITISQGSGSTVTIASGAVKMVYLDGAGAGGAVVEALADLELPTVTVADLTATTADINGGTIDGTVIGGTTPAAVTTSSLVATTADINAGTIDGTVIGGSSAAAITGTTITGTSFVSSGDMTFGDDDKAIFGAGNDLEIYHDGSNSYIRDTGTGNLNISADQLRVLNAGNNEIKAEFTTDGAVDLYHNNALKLATTSTGIDVTGTVTADGLTTNTAGTSNFIAGVNAGNSITSGGNYNVVVGDEAGTAITTGDYNTTIGFSSGTALTTGEQNVIIGALAGDALTDADYNVVIGIAALSADTLGSRSTAIGHGALENQNFISATDTYNTAVGYVAGLSITTGVNNTLIGGLAGDAITTGSNNAAVGSNGL